MLLLVVLAGVVAIIGVFSIQGTVQRNLAIGYQINNLAHQAREAVSEVERLETFFLANYERSGLTNTRSVVTQSVPLRVAEFEQYLSEIADHVTTSGDAQQTWSSDVVTLMNAYNEGILGLIDAVEQRGYIDSEITSLNVEEFGSIGVLRVSADALHAAASEADGGSSIQNLLLELETVEANYIVRGAVQDRFQINSLIDEIRKSTESDPELYDIDMWDELLSAHQSSFEALYRQDIVVERAIQANRGSTIAINRQLEQIETMALEWVDSANQAIFTRVSGVLALISGAIVIAFVVGMVLAAIVTRSITRPLGHITRTAKAISAGDLSQQVNISTKDEVGDLANAFDSMAQDLQHTMESERTRRVRLETMVGLYTDFVQHVAEGDLTTRLNFEEHMEQSEQYDDLLLLGSNLNHMVEQLNHMATQILLTAKEVSDATQEILQATIAQTSSAVQQETAISETLAVVTQVQSTASQTAQQAHLVARTSQESLGVSSVGRTAVEDAVGGMEDIQVRVEGIANNILELSERTQQIGEIIDTVNQLADQSKLLALNASIEAARAGEEGRSFAVVAMEVRQLAGESREATLRVQSILEQIQQATNTSVMATEEGIKGAAVGVELVGKAGDTIRNLTNTIESSAQLGEQIAVSTTQQTTGMDQLLTAITSIRQASGYAANSTRQAEQSAKSLHEMAGRMQSAVAQYQLSVEQPIVATAASDEE